MEGSGADAATGLPSIPEATEILLQMTEEPWIEWEKVRLSDGLSDELRDDDCEEFWATLDHAPSDNWIPGPKVIKTLTELVSWIPEDAKVRGIS